MLDCCSAETSYYTSFLTDWCNEVLFYISSYSLHMIIWRKTAPYIAISMLHSRNSFLWPEFFIFASLKLDDVNWGQISLSWFHQIKNYYSSKFLAYLNTSLQTSDVLSFIISSEMLLFLLYKVAHCTYRACCWQVWVKLLTLVLEDTLPNVCG